MFLRRFLPFARGIPSHDMLCEVIAAADPEVFKTCFTHWVDRLCIAGPDPIGHRRQDLAARPAAYCFGLGEAAQGSARVASGIPAEGTGQQLVLGQEAVSEKSNEIITIRSGLQCLELAGVIVTIDTMGTQAQIAQTILDGGGDYGDSVRGCGVNSEPATAQGWVAIGSAVQG